MKLEIRRTYTFVENRSIEAGKAASIPLRKVAAALVMENPYAGRYVKDLNPLIKASAALGRELATMAAGTMIDIPMNCKDALYVRSHYDGMTLVLPDAPMSDEIAVILCLANRGRLNARVGGLRHDQLKGENGLV